MISKILGERLRNYRNQKGWSQEKLAERAGLHPTYIGQLERGEKNATIDSICKVANALEIPLEQLFEKINQIDAKNNIASECYDIILSRPVDEQEQLRSILIAVICYKGK